MTTQQPEKIEYCPECELEYAARQCAPCPLCPLREQHDEAMNDARRSEPWKVVSGLTTWEIQRAINHLEASGWSLHDFQVGHSSDGDIDNLELVAADGTAGLQPRTPRPGRPAGGRTLRPVPRAAAADRGRGRRIQGSPLLGGEVMRSVNATAVCAWCGRSFQRPPRGSGQPREYCSRLHEDWSHKVLQGGYPLTDCPRCRRRDMLVAAPDWAICQTCGHQTDRPDLAPGALTPRGNSLVMGELKNLTA